MSGLEKFANTEEWRARLRDLLLKESNPQPKNFSTEQEQRYSLDISEDLQMLINNAKLIKKMNGNKETENDNKENKVANEKKFEFLQTTKTVKNDETFMDFEQMHVKSQISDESFEDSLKVFESLELMCNKTASDPDSDHFLHTNEKQKVLNAVKSRLSDVLDPLKTEKGDAESVALDRLLNELCDKEQQQIAEQSILKSEDMTQIEDIEAPSRLWDNTVLQTSPVKMVGLLRPSTIMECAENSDVSSTQASYQSALRAPLSEISSSCYETASDTFSFNKERKHKENLNLHTTNLIDLENTIKVEEIDDNLIEFSYKEDPNETKNDSVMSKKVDLIDLTIDANEASDQSDEESVIEVLSGDEDIEVAIENKIPTFKFNDVNISPVDADNNLTFSNATNDDRDDDNNDEKSAENLDFNDTLEEVEYLMKKGLEFMTQTGAIPKTTASIKSPVETSKTKNFQGFSPKRVNTATAYSPHKSASKLPNRFAIEMKPPPKFELFKKPITASKLPISANRNKEKFAHVISPIGAYIKKTPEAPLMTSVKAKDKDMNSTVFRELEFESRQYQPQFKNSNRLGISGIAALPKSPVSRSLPKKAYISSEYRQIVDQRNAVTIPGGNSIQKYLGNVVLPAVIQHDGKAKIAENSSELPSKSKRLEGDVRSPNKFESKNDDSYANLSVITGDVSLYTIKDAQKF